MPQPGPSGSSPPAIAMGLPLPSTAAAPPVPLFGGRDDVDEQAAATSARRGRPNESLRDASRDMTNLLGRTLRPRRPYTPNSPLFAGHFAIVMPFVQMRSRFVTPVAKPWRDPARPDRA